MRSMIYATNAAVGVTSAFKKHRHGVLRNASLLWGICQRHLLLHLPSGLPHPLLGWAPPTGLTGQRFPTPNYTKSPIRPPLGHPVAGHPLTPQRS